MVHLPAIAAKIGVEEGNINSITQNGKSTMGLRINMSPQATAPSKLLIT
jgi:hypothetical protein